VNDRIGDVIRCVVRPAGFISRQRTFAKFPFPLALISQTKPGNGSLWKCKNHNSIPFYSTDTSWRSMDD